ncbi:unnamed protein product, partial [Mesorhabditis belari]|uniref:Uncharacterized protein n=1 Tax=Mesorhabditis belari TaxID=2138241 RepID=A0AAF3J7X9_9BILA
MGESMLSAEQYADLYKQKKYEYTVLIKEGQLVFERSDADADADGLSMLRTVVYEAGLLLKGKMCQFEDLLNRYFRPIEKDPQPVIINDLAGWWDLLELLFKKIDERILGAKEVIKKSRMDSNNNQEALNETRNSQHRRSITELNTESRAFNERIKQKIECAYKFLESLNGC